MRTLTGGRRIWPVSVFTGAMFVMFAAIAWSVARTMMRSPVRDVFDLAMLLFQGFWLLGWSVGVVILGALTLFLVIYGVSAGVETRELVPEKGAASFLQQKRRRVFQEADTEPLSRLSFAALIGANLVPLVGVLFFGWDLPTIMVLFWSESAVVGFYTALKMAATGKGWATFAILFFLGHFGGFMTMHFLFIYAMFIRGIHAPGQEGAIRDVLMNIFSPLWIPLAALFVSHGVSFVSNFIGRREYERTTTQALMSAPYSRILVMQLTVIFGGWVVLLLKNPVPALALLVVLKIGADLMSHKKEHQGS